MTVPPDLELPPLTDAEKSDPVQRLVAAPARARLVAEAAELRQVLGRSR